MFEFVFAIKMVEVFVTINLKAHEWSMYAEDMVYGNSHNTIWDYDFFMEVFQEEMEKRGLVATDPFGKPCEEWLYRWENHFFEDGEYNHSQAGGYFDFINDIDEKALPKFEASSPNRRNVLGFFAGLSSKEIRDYKRSRAHGGGHGSHGSKRNWRRI